LVMRPWRERMRSRAGWSEASGFTISDLTMIRKEMAAGFVVAGFAAALVPTWFWRAIFLTGHGFWSSLENVVLGPFVAIISFVCSVGNVPLAAALWKGGISFGGVVSFVFADLITIPLLLIYRKYFGARLTLRLLAAFWAVMSIAGLATEYVFKLAQIVPANQLRLTSITHIGVNYTTVLNGLAALAFVVLYWLYRSGVRRTDADSSRYAKDVVCGMQVEKAHAPARGNHDGQALYFCSDHCQQRFVATPDRFLSEPTRASADEATDEHGSTEIDRVCGMPVTQGPETIRHDYAGKEYYFCSTGCRDRFASDPMAHLSAARDPVCGMTVDIATAPSRGAHDGIPYVFCCPGCRDAFLADPTSYLDTLPGGVRLHQLRLAPPSARGD
jgi:YHS domain-containing protein